MEHLPVEIVGDILSRIAEARDVVLASMACREWRRAFREHLRALSFKESDWSGFQRLPVSQLEALMSRTILQTTGLRSLVIEVCFDDCGFPLSITTLKGWLLHTRKSLRELAFDVGAVDVPMNVAEICTCEKLEKLNLVAYGPIHGVDPNYHRFSSLRSLWLSTADISDADLRALLAASPCLESLELSELGLYEPVEDLTVAAPPSLRSFCIRKTVLDSLIFESATVEHLHLIGAHCLECFKFVGKGTLTNLTIAAGSSVLDLEFCDSAASLESIDINKAEITQSGLYRLISRSSKLRKLRLWHVSHQEWSEATGLETVSTDLERLAVCCPQLNLLILGCDLSQYDTLFPFCLGGSTHFKSMVYLKVGLSVLPYLFEEEKVPDEFFHLVEGLLDRCPRLKQLVISGLNGLKDGPPRLSTRISRIMRKCVDSNVQLDFIASSVMADDF